MTTRRGIKKFDTSHQEASTSKSRLTRQKRKQQEMDQIDDGPAEKKLKESNPQDESVNVNSSQSQLQMESSIVEKLPPEMITKILKYLDTKTVLVCRLVNWKWNGIATKICRSRSDPEIHFKCHKIKRKLIIKDVKRNRSFQNFKKCLDDSKSFPCTRFLFDFSESSTLDNNKDWNKFISDFGQSITCLKLKISNIVDGEEKLAVKLRSLLFTSLSNLEEFGIEMDSYGREFPLFPEYSINQKSNKKPVPVSAPFSAQLPNIKILYLNHKNFPRNSANSGIIYDLLRAAPNLQRIEPFSPECRPIPDFSFLHAQGKLDCLHSAKIKLDTNFLFQMKENPAALEDLTLKELNLQVYYDRNILADASSFLSSLFESHKDELRKISMDPLGDLPPFQLPKMSKVTSLCVQRDLRTLIFPANLDSGMTMKFGDIFPALRSLELKLPLNVAFPSINSTPDSNSSCQTLETLQVSGNLVDSTSIAQIPHLFPKLKHFIFKIDNFHDQSIANFREVGTAIWTHLKKLQSIELVIDVNSPANAFPAIDSCITGFSPDYCEHLYDLLNEEKLDQGKVLGSNLDLDLEAERKNPSILDLKDLRTLQVRLLRRRKTGKNMAKLSLTSVSEEFALKRMDNLTYEIQEI